MAQLTYFSQHRIQSVVEGYDFSGVRDDDISINFRYARFLKEVTDVIEDCVKKEESKRFYKVLRKLTFKGELSMTTLIEV